MENDEAATYGLGLVQRVDDRGLDDQSAQRHAHQQEQQLLGPPGRPLAPLARPRRHRGAGGVAVDYIHEGILRAHVCVCVTDRCETSSRAQARGQLREVWRRNGGGGFGWRLGGVEVKRWPTAAAERDSSKTSKQKTARTVSSVTVVSSLQS